MPRQWMNVHNGRVAVQESGGGGDGGVPPGAAMGDEEVILGGPSSVEDLEGIEDC
jgi:hypothetical protein